MATKTKKRKPTKRKEEEETTTSSNEFLKRIDRDIEQVDNELLQARKYQRSRRKREERKNRKSFREVITSGDDYQTEAYIKFGGEEPILVGQGISREYSSSVPSGPKFKARTIRKEWKKRKRPYTFIDKKAMNVGEKRLRRRIPQEKLLGKFIEDDEMKSLVLATMDPKTNALLGYTVIRKTKHSPTSNISQARSFMRTYFGTNYSFDKKIQDVLEEVHYQPDEDGRPRYDKKRSFRKTFEELAEHYNLKVKYVDLQKKKKKKTRKKKKRSTKKFELKDLEDFDPTPKNRTLGEVVD